MVTRVQPVATAPKTPLPPCAGMVPLVEAAPDVGYTAETVRKMWWDASPPPPLRKHRGRWFVVPAELRRWADDRDGIPS